jgi:hypothetical protein
MVLSSVFSFLLCRIIAAAGLHRAQDSYNAGKNMCLLDGIFRIVATLV